MIEPEDRCAVADERACAQSSPEGRARGRRWQSRVSDPGVDDRVQQIGDQVEQRERDREQEHRRLDDRIVTVLDGIGDERTQATKTRVLSTSTVATSRNPIWSEVTVRTGMSALRRPCLTTMVRSGQSLGAGRLDEVGRQDLDHGAPRHPGRQRDHPERQGHGRQQQVASLIEQIGPAPPERWQHSQPDGEHEDARIAVK